jgi:hypothetical protein
LDDVSLQLLFPVGISGWAGGLAAASVPRGLRFVEVCESMGNLQKKALTTEDTKFTKESRFRVASGFSISGLPIGD